MSAQPLRFRKPIVSDEGGSTEVRLPVDGHDDICFRVDSEAGWGPSADSLGNLCLTVGLIPAMCSARPLVIEAPVCPQLLATAPTLQNVFSCWWDGVEKVEVEAPTLQETGSPPAEVEMRRASFFSGGVDSMYTTRIERGGLDSLVFVHGFDIPHNDVEKADLVRGRIRAAAVEIGLPLVSVWTNLRDFSEPLDCYWGERYFGAALAAVGHLLSSGNDTIFLPGSGDYAALEPWGSHPMTDPLWSSSAASIVHHGCECSRTEKIAAIGDWQVARNHLRVCWEGGSAEYNCGRCEKCQRTLAALRATGLEEGFAALFDGELDLEQLAAYRAEGTVFLNIIKDILRHAERLEAPAELIDALRECVAGNEAAITVKRFAKQNNEVLASAEWQRLLPKQRNKLFKSLTEEDPDWFVERLGKLLPESRTAILELLFRHDRKWLAKAVRQLRRGKGGLE